MSPAAASPPASVASPSLASTDERPDAPSSMPGHRLRELNALLDRPCAELERLYNGARAPRLGDVAGDLRGRMLAWPSLEKRPKVAGAIRAFAGSKVFPWRGKSFSATGPLGGEGINRVVSERF